MKFKNHEIKPMHDLLYVAVLKGKESRMRTRFTNLLRDHLNILVTEEIELLKEFAEKNSDGSFKLDPKNPTMPQIIKEKEDIFQSEHIDLMNEDFYIEENEANKMVLLQVADIMLNGDFEVSGDVAVLYDKWCEQFEEVKQRYAESEG